MDVEVTKLPESRVTLKVELTPQEVDQALERTYKLLVQRVSVPGFRKGKAPRPVVERLVGRERFLHEATDEVVRWGYRKAVDQQHLTPIDEAEIQPGDDHDHVQPGERFQFEATVAVKPEVQLPDYHAIHIEPPKIEVTDSDVDQLLQALRERNATLEPTIRSAQVGDVVTMSITGKVDGREVLNSENADFELRDEENQEPDETLPGLSVELEGTNRGDIREVTLPLPELYGDQDLAGKTMFLRILVKEIKRKVLPEVDDSFVESVSELQTVDQLRDALRQNLELERRLEVDETLVSEAVEAVVSRTFVDIPPVLVEEEIDRMVGDLRRAFEQREMSFEMYLETSGRNESEIREEMREAATRSVKSSLVLSAVADAEQIDVTGREVDAALNDLFRSVTMSESERRRLRSSTVARSNLRSRLRRQRALQKLVQIVTGGEEVSTEATEAVADQTAEDRLETVAVEIGS